MTSMKILVEREQSCCYCINEGQVMGAVMLRLGPGIKIACLRGSIVGIVVSCADLCLGFPALVTVYFLQGCCFVLM